MDRTLGHRERDGGLCAPISAIFFLALVVRALALLRTDPVAFDSGIYFEMAQFIRAGNWAGALGYDFPPLYPALIAGVQFLGVRGGAAGLGIALAADLLVLFPLAGIARAAAGETAAWAAAFLWAIHPYAVRLGVQALSDAPTALFVGVAIWAGLRAMDSGRIAWALGAGAASGLAYLARPEGIEPALALAALYAVERRKAKGQRPASGFSQPQAAGTLSPPPPAPPPPPPPPPRPPPPRPRAPPPPR